MDESILISTKKTLGLTEAYTPFDADILTYINSAFSVLDQLGVGTAGGTFVSDSDDLWADLGLPANQLNMVKTYVYLKCRVMFDPPTTSFTLEAMNKQIAEQEWRLRHFADTVRLDAEGA